MSAAALNFDVVVIGAGTAGLACGALLAQDGARVCVVARGHGSTHLAAGTIDVAGYVPAPASTAAPGSGPASVSVQPMLPAASAAAGVQALIAAVPDHPYAKLGAARIEQALAWFQRAATNGPYPGYEYSGGLDRNLRLPTAAGALRPSALAPVTIASGDGDTLGKLAVVGTPALRDFHPALCAGNLRAAGVDATAVELELQLDRADMTTQGIARRLDDDSWRARFCAQLRPLIGDAEQVALPAMLGLRDPHAVLADLQQRLEARVFEIPTLPPSVPGMRLYEILRCALRAAGGRLVLGPSVVAHERSDARVRSITTAAAGHELRYRADAFVLAGGGCNSGAIELDADWRLHERVLELPLTGLPPAGQPRFAARYHDEQPLARVGIATDGELRAEGVDNVFVAGAALAGAASWREGSGEGVALASAHHVADAISNSLTTAARAAR